MTLVKMDILSYLFCVNVIAPKTVRAFLEQYPEAEDVLRDWYNALRKSEFQNFAQLKAMFSSVDLIESEKGSLLVVFDVGGNKYRVIVKIDLKSNLALIRHILTHQEYNFWNKKGKPS
jgi:mRNA interferase HigB